MPLRRRLAFVAAAAVAVAIVLVAIVSYMVVKAQLRGQVDDALRAQAAAVQGAGGVDQLLGAVGQIDQTASNDNLDAGPVDDLAKQVSQQRAAGQDTTPTAAQSKQSPNS